MVQITRKGDAMRDLAQVVGDVGTGRAHEKLVQVAGVPKVFLPMDRDRVPGSHGSKGTILRSFGSFCDSAGQQGRLGWRRSFPTADELG